MEAINENIEEKYPKLATYISKFKVVWRETFPDPEKKMANRMTERKKLAKQQREMEEAQEKLSPEELEELEKSIPEWKRNALVLQGEEIKEEKPGVFGRLKDRIKSTDAAKNFKESEEYEKLSAARNEFKDTVGKFKEGIENT